MPIPVQIRDIVDGMEFQSGESTSYLQRASGEVFTVSDDEFAAGAIAADEDGPEAIARSIDGNPDAYIPLPDQFEINEYRMMERFAHTVSDALQEQLLMSLRGAGAFRRFKDAVHRAGAAPAWYHYRDGAYAQVARDWCLAHGIDFQDTPPSA